MQKRVGVLILAFAASGLAAGGCSSKPDKKVRVESEETRVAQPGETHAERREEVKIIVE